MTLSDAERQELEDLRTFRDNWARWTTIDLHAEDNKATVEVRAELVRGLTVMLVEWFLKDSKAENYAELSVFHEETGPLAMTVQRVWGKTPHDLKVEAEEKLAKIEEAGKLLVLYMKGMGGGPWNGVVDALESALYPEEDQS